MHDKVFVRDLIGVAVLILILFMASLLLGSCAVYKGSRVAPNGVITEVEVWTLMHEAEDVKVKYDNRFEMEIGKIGSAVDEDKAFCILFPHRCSPDGD